MALVVDGVSLPSIPTDVLKTYPYVLIESVTGGDESGYLMIMSTSNIYYVTSGLITDVNYNSITSEGTSVIYGCATGASTWSTYSTSTYAAKTVIGAVGTYTVNSVTYSSTFVWSNCDISIVTAIDSSGNYTTAGLYFTCTLGTTGTAGENITIGSTTLTGIPSDILAIYPYALISKMNYTSDGSTTTIYILSAATGQMGYFSPDLTGNSYGTIYSSGACVTYMTMGELSSWETGSPIAVGQPVCYEGTITSSDTLTVTNTPIWTNNDIYSIASYNTSTGSYAVGDVYLSASNYSGGLGDITDEGTVVRLSIGYELWKSIVDETRRISGTIGLLNATEVLTMLQSVTGDTSGSTGGMITSNVGLTYGSFASSKGVTLDTGSNKTTGSGELELSDLTLVSEATGTVVI